MDKILTKIRRPWARIIFIVQFTIPVRRLFSSSESAPMLLEVNVGASTLWSLKTRPLFWKTHFFKNKTYRIYTKNSLRFNPRCQYINNKPPLGKCFGLPLNIQKTSPGSMSEKCRKTHSLTHSLISSHETVPCDTLMARVDKIRLDKVYLTLVANKTEHTLAG